MAKQANKIREQQRKVVREVRNFITIMGVEAVNHYKKSFRDGGFTDRTLRTWPQRKGGNDGRAVLVKSGDLRRSIKVKRKTLKSVTIGSDLPYAPVHNDGLRAGRGRGFRMPKRQFVGASQLLTIKLKRRMNIRMKRIFK